MERSESFGGGDLIISVHIPKTGGTTFLEVLRGVAEDVVYLDYGAGTAPTGLYRGGIKVADQFAPIPNFDSMFGRSVIHGHFRMGKYFPKFPKATYVTWLRDPVERLASHYFFWQRTTFKTDPLWNKVIGEKMSFEQFAQMDIARNVQHRFLSPAGVDGFAFAGITEEYERSLELFRRLICPDLEIVPTMQNANPNRLNGSYDLDPEVRERILLLNELDVAIYASGLRRFRRLCEQTGI